MRKVFVLLCLCFACFAKQLVEVSASHFKGLEKELKAILSDNVVVKSEEGILRCELLVVFYDKDKKPIKYEASKNLNFDIKLKNSHYKGVANKLIYTADNDKYTMIGNVYIQDISSNKDIKADKIVFDAKSGNYTISGKNEKEPIILKFELGK